MKHYALIFAVSMSSIAVNPLAAQDDRSDIDPEFLDSLLESIEQPGEPAKTSEASLLQRAVNQIDEHLQAASGALAAGDVGQAAQLAQQNALEMMRSLLSGSQSQSNSNQQRQQSTQRQSETQRQSQTQTDDELASDQPAQTGNTDGQPGNKAGERPNVTVSLGPATLIKGDIWGHLPERIRSQLRATNPDQFLPSYRDAIANYYRMLAEQSSDRRVDK